MVIIVIITIINLIIAVIKWFSPMIAT